MRDTAPGGRISSGCTDGGARCRVGALHAGRGAYSTRRRRPGLAINDQNKEPSMRGTGNGLWLAAGAGRGVGLAGRRHRRLVRHWNRHLRRESPRSQAARHGRRPRVRQEALGTGAERDAGPRQRQHHGEHHGLGLEGAPGREDLSRSQDSGGHRSERLSVQAARDGDHGRSALQDPQLRRRPPQHPHASQGQHAVQQGDAGDGQGGDDDVRQAGGDLPRSSATSTRG